MIKALNLIGMYVSDPYVSVDFYQKLGFTILSQDKNTAEVTLGDMKLGLTAVSTAKASGPKFEREANADPKGAGVYLNIEVSDIDSFYQNLTRQGLTPSSRPRDWPWGQREFALRDPDGYKLIFYEKLESADEGESSDLGVKE